MKKHCKCKPLRSGSTLKKVDDTWICPVCKTEYVKLRDVAHPCRQKSENNMHCRNIYYDATEGTLSCHTCGKIYKEETGKEIKLICEEMGLDCSPAWDSYHKVFKCQACGDIFVRAK